MSHARTRLESPEDDSNPVTPDAGLALPTTLGPYQLVSRLAVGGMAEVWKAKLPGDDRLVAIKTVLPGAGRSADLERMFRDEAELGARLEHPHIVKFLGAGCAEGRQYIVTEFVAGLTLRELARRLRGRGQKFPIPLLVQIVRQTCAALHHAHELTDRGVPLGFVHGDVSPENVMVTRGGDAKLIDFGAARLTAKAGSTGPLMGKFLYVAPERIEGTPADRRADVYALGVILYEYLTGVLPYQGNDVDLLGAIVAGRARHPRAIAPELPESLAAIVMRAMAPRREQRDATAADLGRALATFGAGSRVSPPAPGALPEGRPPAPVERFAPDGEHGNDEITRRVPELFARHGAVFDRRHPAHAPSGDAWSHGAGGRDPFAVRSQPKPTRPVERRRPVNADAAAAFERGLALARLGQREAALAEWERACALDPDHRLYRINLKRLRTGPAGGRPAMETP
jgi:serine/threonine protein kinase